MAHRAILFSLAVMACSGAPSVPEDGSPLEASSPPPGRCLGGEAALVRGVGYPTAQLAIDALGVSGRVWLCPGVHDGPLENHVAERLEIASYSGNAADTIVDGYDSVPVVIHSVTTYSTVAFRGITFRNGYATGTDFPFQLSFSDVYVSDCVFSDNHSERGVGTLLVYGDRSVVARSEFYRNDGPLAIIAVGLRDVRHVLSSLLFQENVHLSSTLGVGLSSRYFSRRAILDDLEFVDNSGGVAVSVNATDALIGIRDVEIARQQSTGVSGLRIAGTRRSAATRVEVDNLNISDSSGSSAAFALEGGWSPLALEVDWASGSVVRNTDVSTFPGAPANRYGGALGLERAVQLDLSDVDLGDGPDDNLMPDIGGCPGEYGPGTTLTVSGIQGAWCP